MRYESSSHNGRCRVPEKPASAKRRAAPTGYGGSRTAKSVDGHAVSLLTLIVVVSAAPVDLSAALRERALHLRLSSDLLPREPLEKIAGLGLDAASALSPGACNDRLEQSLCRTATSTSQGPQGDPSSKRRIRTEVRLRERSEHVGVHSMEDDSISSGGCLVAQEPIDRARVLVGGIEAARTIRFAPYESSIRLRTRAHGRPQHHLLAQLARVGVEVGCDREVDDDGVHW